MALDKNKTLLNRAAELLKKNSAIESTKHEIELKLKNCTVISGELNELERYLSVGFPELVATVNRQQREVMRLTGEIGGLEIKQLTSNELVSSTLPLPQFQLHIAQREKD